MMKVLYTLAYTWSGDEDDSGDAKYNSDSDVDTMLRNGERGGEGVAEVVWWYTQNSAA